MRKGNNSIATINLLAQNIWSNDFFSTFVIMQVVLLNICLAQR